MANTSMCTCACAKINSCKGRDLCENLHQWNLPARRQMPVLEVRGLMCWYLFSSLHVCGWVALSELLCTAMTDMYPTRSQSEAQSLWSYIASNRILINWSSRARESDFLLLSVSEPLLSTLWLVCPASTVQLQLQECQLSTKYLIEWHGSGSCNRRLQKLVPPARFLRYLSLPWLPWSKFLLCVFQRGWWPPGNNFCTH